MRTKGAAHFVAAQLEVGGIVGPALFEKLAIRNDRGVYI
jgi:hypothetical protein